MGSRSVCAGVVVRQEAELGTGPKRVESNLMAVVLPRLRIVVPPMALVAVSSLGSPLLLISVTIRCIFGHTFS